MAKIDIPMGRAEDTQAQADAQAASASRSGEARVTLTDRDGNQTVTGGDTQGASGQVATRPDNVPEKFWNAETGTVNQEALLASYRELESARGKPNKADTEGTPEEKPEGEPEASLAPTSEITAAAASEFAANGALSDETFGALEKAGFSRPMVEQYIMGAQAASERSTQEVLAGAGTTRAAFDAAAEWAKDNLPDEEALRLNTALAQSKESAVYAVRDLIARHAAEADVSPEISIGGAPSSSGLTPLKSKGSIQAAMRDPRYKKDSAYRSEVYARITLAQKQGINPYAQ